MYRTKIVAFFLALAIGACSGSDECELPTKSQLEDVIGLIIQAGDNAAAPDVELTDSQIVCSAFGEQEGLLRQVSVVVEYTCTGHGNCLLSTATEQIETECNGGNWTNVVGGSTDDVRLESPTATLTTPDRDDCAFCLSPDKAVSVDLNAPAPDVVTHCAACNSSCEGIGRCFGLDDSDCCNFYNSSLCVDVCPTPFTPNSDNDCVCPEGTTGFNCNELVDCGNLTAPDNGEVLLTGTVFDSMATYSCDPGYVLYGDATRICLADGSWSGNEPACEDCGGLSDPLNGMVSLTGTVLGSTATYTCNAGYTLIGEDTRTCENDGEWSGEEPTCTECIVPGCLTCDKPEVCIECEENYELANDICKCLVPGCIMCASDKETCDECDENSRLDEARTSCISQDDNGDGGGLPPGAIAGIILALILLAILLALAIALIAYFAKRYWDKVHTKSHDITVEQPKEAHENPLYVGPEDALEGVDRGTVVPVEEDGISPSEGTGASNGSE